MSIKFKKKYILWGVVLLCLFSIFGVARHSVDEIHYLKRSFPVEFTVEEAYYAAQIEFYKVLIICLPLAVLIFIALYLLKGRKKVKHKH